MGDNSAQQPTACFCCTSLPIGWVSGLCMFLFILASRPRTAALVMSHAGVQTQTQVSQYQRCLVTYQYGRRAEHNNSTPSKTTMSHVCGDTHMLLQLQISVLLYHVGFGSVTWWQPVKGERWHLGTKRHNPCSESGGARSGDFA